MNLLSLGFAAGIYQQDPRVIKVALGPIGKSKPAMTLNGVVYFEADATAAAIGWLVKFFTGTTANVKLFKPGEYRAKLDI